MYVKLRDFLRNSWTPEPGSFNIGFEFLKDTVNSRTDSNFDILIQAILQVWNKAWCTTFADTGVFMSESQPPFWRTSDSTRNDQINAQASTQFCSPILLVYDEMIVFFTVKKKKKKKEFLVKFSLFHVNSNWNQIFLQPEN